MLVSVDETDVIERLESCLATVPTAGLPTSVGRERMVKEVIGILLFLLAADEWVRRLSAAFSTLLLFVSLGVV